MDEYVLKGRRVATTERIDELMQQYGQDILQLVYTYVRDHALAEDLTQEIFLKCYKAYPTFQGKSSVKTWLWRIAINHTKDYLKSWYNQHVQSTEQTVLQHVGDGVNVEQTIIQQDEEAALAEAVLQLPVLYREVIYLYYFEECTIKEIAAILPANENTVKTRLRKGKGLLKERLEAAQWTSN